MATEKNKSPFSAARTVSSFLGAGIVLKPYQETGVRFLLERRSALLADDMGLGKTAQGLAAVASLNQHIRAQGNNPRSSLIVAPASLTTMWEREGRAFGVDLDVISYSSLHKLDTEKPYLALLLDECHFVKNAFSKRTQAACKIKSAVRWGFSGTPILNRPEELWALLAVLGVTTMSYEDWVYRYCDGKRVNKFGKWVLDASGASNLEELHRNLSKYMLRRTKADVKLQLPPKTRQVIELPLPQDADWLFMDEDMDLAARTNLTADMDFEKALRSLTVVANNQEHISILRQKTGVAKVAPTVAYLNDTDDGTKTLVFAQHREVIERLYGSLCMGGRAVMVYGGMTSKAKDEAVSRFMHDPKATYFIGSLGAAGVGWTLTAATRWVAVEQDWRPGVMIQAEDRAHRIGQCLPVTCTYLVFDQTIDALLARAFIRKQSLVDKIVDGKF